ncbi:hypothetical protein EMGBS3_08240, partial [Anaerolineaceae bacterium]
MHRNQHDEQQQQREKLGRLPNLVVAGCCCRPRRW